MWRLAHSAFHPNPPPNHPHHARLRRQLGAVPHCAAGDGHRRGELHHHSAGVGGGGAVADRALLSPIAGRRGQLAVGADAVRLRRRFFLRLSQPYDGDGRAAALRRGAGDDDLLGPVARRALRRVAARGPRPRGGRAGRAAAAGAVGAAARGRGADADGGRGVGRVFDPRQGGRRCHARDGGEFPARGALRRRAECAAARRRAPGCGGRRLRAGLRGDHLRPRLRHLVHRAAGAEGDERGDRPAQRAGDRRAGRHRLPRRGGDTALRAGLDRRPRRHRTGDPRAVPQGLTFPLTPTLSPHAGRGRGRGAVWSGARA